MTSFEYRLHPVGPQVLAGTLTYPPGRLRAVLKHYADLAAQAPRELAIDLAMNPDAAGDRIPYLLFCYVGAESQGEKMLRSLRTATGPSKDSVRLRNYVDIQKDHDGPVLSDYAEYSKTGYVPELSPALVDALSRERSQPQLALSLVGGAIADVPPSDTAVTHRRAQLLLEIDAEWQDLNEDDEHLAAVHATWNRLSPFTSGFYANLTNADRQAVHDNYGTNRVRLMEIKKRYDPDNFFRLNANIRPA